MNVRDGSNSASVVSSGSTGLNWAALGDPNAWSKAASMSGYGNGTPETTTPLTAPFTNPPSDTSLIAEDYASGQGDNSLDASGYDQAQWEFERQQQLLAEQRAFNSAEAEKQRQWQERMSNTAYQRAIEDIQAAGLNKWLAITGGNGASASTPSGASATSSAGDASAPNPGIYKALLEYMKGIVTSAIKIVDFF